VVNEQVAEQEPSAPLGPPLDRSAVAPQGVDVLQLEADRVIGDLLAGPDVPA